MLDARIRPLAWPLDQPRTAERDRRSRWTFKAPWSSTLDLLERELRMLRARDVVIEAGFRDRDLRLDGWPRGDALVPKDPGVILSFHSGLVGEDLRYACDGYGHWEANLRAIGLGLEALRAVDRYGISTRHEQYRGYRALGAGIEMGAAMSPEFAAEFLIEHGEWGGTPASVEDVLEADDAVLRAYFRSAAMKLHPDTGGDSELFKRLTEARETLEARAGRS